MTRAGPWRSAIAPNSGCDAPHTNWPTASARLMSAMSSPVDRLTGAMYRPSDCRAPVVMSKIAAAESISGQAVARGLASASVLMRSNPKPSRGTRPV